MLKVDKEQLKAAGVLLVVILSSTATGWMTVVGAMKIATDPDTSLGGQMFAAGIMLTVLIIAAVCVWGYRKMLRIHRERPR